MPIVTETYPPTDEYPEGQTFTYDNEKFIVVRDPNDHDNLILIHKIKPALTRRDD